MTKQRMLVIGFVGLVVAIIGLRIGAPVAQDTAVDPGLVQALLARVADLEARLRVLEDTAQETAMAEALPGCMTTMPGPGSQDDVVFVGCNVHIQNGLGATNTKNAAGNLIVGYNEDTIGEVNDRSGSHTLVIWRANASKRSRACAPASPNMRGASLTYMAHGRCSTFTGQDTGALYGPKRSNATAST